MAIAQASRIRELEKVKPLQSQLEILIMISCNGVDLTDEDQLEIAEVSDFAIIFPFGISGDINITQGFMHAIRLKVDYLWILSANDKVSDSFLQTIYEGLILKREASILVGCTIDQPYLQKIDSVFARSNRDIPFGLISSVVYRTIEMANNFDTAVQMNWTGWGQLAAIEASCIAHNGIKVSLVNESLLYQRSTRTLENPKEERKRVRNLYSHSFFGMPIVICSLHATNPNKKQEFLDSWIASNWYLVNYFLNTNFKAWNSHIASNQIWLRQLSFAAIRGASVRFRFIFFISKITRFSLLSENKIAQLARKMIKVV